MKNKVLTTIAAAAIAAGFALPSYADGVVGSGMSYLGRTTALIIDEPEGVALNSLWYQPKKIQKRLAVAFGDEKGLFQNLAGFALGVPTGVVWGVPAGIIYGGRHAWSAGWDKPFSTESYIVPESED
ncbi:MAG: hypothetical protein K2Y22_12540 [Candidatus Obscuribacterales bacterium]|nr:hypothetical protein [Candidatus Obscuribacterales bacterium]